MPRTKGRRASSRNTSMSASKSGRTTRDHDEIKDWIETRGGRPATIKGTHAKGGTGVLRVDFPGIGDDRRMEPISWDEFFEKFDDNGLEFLYQDRTAGGRVSRFSRFVGGEGEGSRTSSRVTARKGTTSRGSTARSSTSSRGVVRKGEKARSSRGVGGKGDNMMPRRRGRDAEGASGRSRARTVGRNESRASDTQRSGGRGSGSRGRSETGTARRGSRTAMGRSDVEKTGSLRSSSRRSVAERDSTAPTARGAGRATASSRGARSVGAEARREGGRRAGQVRDAAIDIVW